MKESKITGWQDVFRFTFVQTMLEKSTIISLVIICTILLLSTPVVTLIKNQMNDGEQKSNISTVYVKDDTSFTEADYSTIASEEENYSKVEFVNTDKSLEELTDLVVEEKKAVILHITEEGSDFQIHLIKNPNGGVKDKDMDSLIEKIKARFEDIRILNLQITQEQYDMAYAEVTTDVYVAEIDGGKKDKSVGFADGEIGFLYALAVVPFIFLATAGAMVASSIIIEKSSKVIEYLMISIRPLAIIFGKVLAMFCIMIVQFGLMGISYFASTILNGIIFTGTFNINLNKFITPDILSKLNVGNVFLIVLIYLFGFLFYSVFASLFGSTVSRIEELQEGLSIYTITTIVGFYLAYFLITANMAGSDGGVMIYVVSLLPISAPFIVPAYLLLGKISLFVGLGSLVIQIVTFILLTLFVAKVYETLILHSGNRIKVKDLIKIFKNT